MEEVSVVDDNASSKRLRGRQERLIAELADEGVDLRVDEDAPVFRALIEEIMYARQTPVHEGKRGSYGALVTNDPDLLLALTGNRGQSPIGKLIPLSGTEPLAPNLEDVRKVCNGRTTFLVRSPRGPEFLFELNLLATEQQLAQLVSPEVRVVQRTPDGAVKVFTPSQVYVFEHDEWRSKVYSSEAARVLAKIFFAKRPRSVVLADLLSFCLHVLSSRHIGATFVWFPDPAYPRAATARLETGRLSPAKLYVNQQHTVEALAALLAAIDGACSVGPTGEVERIGMRLAATDSAIDLIAAEPGLRHTSAKRYSFDDPNCIVFVVSHDGPVTVYADGMSVLQLRVGPSYASSMGGVAPEDTFDTHRPKSCSRCGKTLVIERHYVRHHDRPVTVDCPICGQENLESDNAVAMYAWPQKPWAKWGVGVSPE